MHSGDETRHIENKVPIRDDRDESTEAHLGKNITDKVRNEDIRRSRKVEDANEWIHERKIEWRTTDW